jgi:putative addiction module killer protein
MHTERLQILHYTTADGRDVVMQWLGGLRDLTAQARILARIGRMAGGGFGDCKPVGGGVWELRIDHGPGYRVFYARIEDRVVLLLAGGDKRTQKADIRRAQDYLKDWQERKA